MKICLECYERYSSSRWHKSFIIDSNDTAMLRNSLKFAFKIGKKAFTIMGCCDEQAPYRGYHSTTMYDSCFYAVPEWYTPLFTITKPEHQEIKFVKACLRYTDARTLIKTLTALEASSSTIVEEVIRHYGK